MNLRTAIGGTVRELRHQRNLTLRQLSNSSHVALGYLSEVERGHKDASSQILESIAKGLSLSTYQLIKEIYEYLGETNE